MSISSIKDCPFALPFHAEGRMRRWVLSSLLALVPVAVAWLGGVYRLARVPGLPAG
jgi:hypothetical protein